MSSRSGCPWRFGIHDRPEHEPRPSATKRLPFDPNSSQASDWAGGTSPAANSLLLSGALARSRGGQSGLIHFRCGQGRGPVLNAQALLVEDGLLPGLEQEQLATVLVDIHPAGLTLV